ncbi:LPXTG-motif cell wall anchor domain protein [Peptostreptococcus anaerobius 653-L]|uniref:LPXTG-motif cell wall anchor domain protein n=1 Tax=Peptostreptococcus anaerobius 653-L TaxID=596329 RepID=D3MTV0_9FIRM|nr:Cna B-type domain-containing protein [Peptostreptococcus anaerobius]EFD04434.1 LPXTG-motif cell wall anchor domain protein [Peptostreptococcus anaerobius 653-L]
MKGINKSKLLCLFVLLFGIAFNFQNVYASNNINSPEQIDFTISYTDGSDGIKDAEFSIYKIGNIDKNNNISLSEDFSKYPINYDKVKKSQWNEYANTLKGYVKKDKVKAFCKGKTDDKGLLNVKVNKGLYLIVGEDLFTGSYKYMSNPFVVLLPEKDTETGIYLDKSRAYPKLTKETRTKKTIDLDVLKVWDDDGYENKRPGFIEVELLGNGKSKESVRLNKDNNWTYVWKNLDSSVSWTVVEKNVNRKRYEVKVKNYDNSFVITNIYLPATLPKPAPTPQQVAFKKPPMLPQTGQLWWPVYFLSGMGIISIVIGYVKEKRKGEGNEI